MQQKFKKLKNSAPRTCINSLPRTCINFYLPRTCINSLPRTCINFYLPRTCINSPALLPWTCINYFHHCLILILHWHGLVSTVLNTPLKLNMELYQLLYWNCVNSPAILPWTCINCLLYWNHINYQCWVLSILNTLK